MIPSGEGCVCSYCPVASAVGTRVLLDGGNAVDAAVATGLALAITYPQAGNIGGGGFMLVAAPDKEVEFLDYRELAPAKIDSSMFLTSEGELSKNTVSGPLSVAVPGTIAGFAKVLERHGSWAWDRVVSTVIPLADHGLWITNRQARYLTIYKPLLKEFDSTAKAFFQFNELRSGDCFRQPDLAKTLRAIADNGPAEFYTGQVGKRIVAEILKGGGVLDEEDLATYEPKWRPTLKREFFGKTVVTPGLPSSGGIVLLESLGLLQASGIENTQLNSIERFELIARAFRVAFKSRSDLAGDPDFLEEEILQRVKGFATADYDANSLKDLEIAGGLLNVPKTEGEMPPHDTTHFSVIDSRGMAVSNTYSLNTLFGSKFVAEGTGFLLNNTIDDFGVAPNIPNWYSLFQGENNCVRPRARPASSMAPTLVISEKGECELAIGGSGGPRIPTLIAQVLVSMLVSGKDLKEAMQLPRIHHQHIPREIHLEQEPDGWEIGTALEERGYEVKLFPRLGIGAGIHHANNKFTAKLDIRF